jgi:hypothetical protein
MLGGHVLLVEGILVEVEQLELGLVGWPRDVVDELPVAE